MLSAFTRLLATSGPERFVKTGVSDPQNVLQSEQGRYYVGRTGLVDVPVGHEALVMIGMPEAGTRRAFVVSITVTSNLGRRAIFYYGVQTPVAMRRSPKVACAHRGAPDEPQTVIQMTTAVAVPLTAGISVFERLLVGGDTLVLEQQGRVILEPGEEIGLWFEAAEADDQIDVALGWWEEPLR